MSNPTANAGPLFTGARSRLAPAFAIEPVGDDVLERLRHPRAMLSVSVPVRMDDGALRVFQGYRCRYDDTRGPAKGGIRFHPGVTADEVTALAFWMTIKCAVAGIPYGGGKGGVVVDPKQLSHRELERLSRGYIRAVADFIGPDSDIPAPDVYTNATIMGWMMDEYSAIVRQRTPAVITGKPIALGGSLGRDDATARGGWNIIKSLVRREGWNPPSMTVAVQGFGNAGLHIARMLHDEGFKVVAVSDSQGGIHRAGGFDVPSLAKVKEESRTLSGVYCEGGLCRLVPHDRITNAALLELPVDILIPAAMENQITAENAGRVRAKWILELANGPVTPEADAILETAGTRVIPDVLANSGGVIVSYFEWVQNRMGLAWPLEEVHARLAAAMTAAFDALLEIQSTHHCPMRVAAYVLALRRIAEAMEAGGTRRYFQE